MPLQYSSIVAEHKAVRDSVGIFDVSHLGNARVIGPGAKDFVNACLTNDLGRIAPGQAQYTLCCAEDGGVVDDLIQYYVADDDIFLIPNAANTAEVVRRMREKAPEGIEVTDRRGVARTYPAVLFTTQSWLLTTNIDVEEALFSQPLWMALDRTRYMQSSKTFVMVDRPFWHDRDPVTGRPLPTLKTP